MTFLIILGLLLLIVYAILFSNRDQTQDYKLNQQYRNLPSDKKLEIELKKMVDKLVKRAFESSPQGFEGFFVRQAIESARVAMCNNAMDMSNEYKLSITIVAIIIDQCVDNAYKEYLE